VCGELSQFILIYPESEFGIHDCQRVWRACWFLKVLSNTSSIRTLCHLLLLLHPTVTSASRSLDKIKVFRVQYAVVTSTVSGEINMFQFQRLSPLILFLLRATWSCISQINSCPLCRTVFSRADCRKLYVDVDVISSCSDHKTDSVLNDKIKNVQPLYHNE